MVESAGCVAAGAGAGKPKSSVSGSTAPVPSGASASWSAASTEAADAGLLVYTGVGPSGVSRARVMRDERRCTNRQCRLGVYEHAVWDAHQPLGRVRVGHDKIECI